MGWLDRVMTGATIDSTDNLEYGFSADGLKNLDESLNQLLYEDVKSALNDLNKEVNDSLKDCWQGKSKERYLNDLEDRIDDIIDEIGDEYSDLQRRFEDLAKFYAEEDENLYSAN